MEDNKAKKLYNYLSSESFNDKLVASGMATKDKHVYMMKPIINSVLAGSDVPEAERKELGEKFPKFLELLDYFAKRRDKSWAYGRKLSYFSFTPGPEATVETLSEVLLKELQDSEKFWRRLQMWWLNSWLGKRFNPLYNI